MPGMYHGNDYDLAGFAVGAAERGTPPPRPDVKPGDAIVAIGSSGVHSNGYLLVRKIVEISGVDWCTCRRCLTRAARFRAPCSPQPAST